MSSYPLLFPSVSNFFSPPPFLLSFSLPFPLFPRPPTSYKTWPYLSPATSLFPLPPVTLFLQPLCTATLAPAELCSCCSFHVMFYLTLPIWLLDIQTSGNISSPVKETKLSSLSLSLNVSFMRSGTVSVLSTTGTIVTS